jgi:hypothetical protein
MPGCVKTCFSTGIIAQKCRISNDGQVENGGKRGKMRKNGKKGVEELIFTKMRCILY